MKNITLEEYGEVKMKDFLKKVAGGGHTTTSVSENESVKGSVVKEVVTSTGQKMKVDLDMPGNFFYYTVSSDIINQAEKGDN